MILSVTMPHVLYETFFSVL